MLKIVFMAGAATLALASTAHAAPVTGDQFGKIRETGGR
jgi:hypothetical protein